MKKASKGVIVKLNGNQAVKKYDDDGQTGFEKRQAKKIAKAKTKAAVAEIEGEGSVSQKRNNRADRASVVLGSKREKTPKSVSTSTSTSNSNVDNRNSGNTTNTTNSGSSSGSNSGAEVEGGAGGRSGSSSGVDNSRKSSTSVSQSQNNSRTTNNTSNTNVRQSQNNSKNTSVNQSQDNTKYTDKSTTNYTDKSTKSNVNQSRRNTQIGTGNTSTKNSNLKKGGSVKKYKTGGMVNSNAKVSAIKSAGSKGVKSGVNTKVSKQTSAKGRVGGTSTAPKRAVPKAKMGGSKKSC
jgi:epidermal growth factor receptor substrate 15